MNMFMSSNNPLSTPAWDLQEGLEDQATSEGRRVCQPYTWRKYIAKDLEDNFRWM